MKEPTTLKLTLFCQRWCDVQEDMHKKNHSFLTKPHLLDFSLYIKVDMIILRWIWLIFVPSLMESLKNLESSYLVFIHIILLYFFVDDSSCKQGSKFRSRPVVPAGIGRKSDETVHSCRSLACPPVAEIPSDRAGSSKRSFRHKQKLRTKLPTPLEASFKASSAPAFFPFSFSFFFFFPLPLLCVRSAAALRTGPCSDRYKLLVQNDF